MADKKRFFGQYEQAPDVTNSAGIAGQANNNPLSFFRHHVVVYYDGTYYDPSYGTTYSSLDDFEDQALVGYYRKEEDAGIDEGYVNVYRADLTPPQCLDEQDFDFNGDENTLDSYTWDLFHIRVDLTGEDELVPHPLSYPYCTE